MNRISLTFLLVCLTAFLPVDAQAQAKYGTVSRQSIMAKLPEMKVAQTQIDSLRAQYAREVRYNETSFRRQFSEFLQVQKNLPESILRKRQGDLQLAMERALAFRQQAEATLREAEAALIDRVRQRVDAAIRTVGQERGYELIIDTDSQSTPFVAPSLTEDATPWVAAKLQNAAR